MVESKAAHWVVPLAASWAGRSAVLTAATKAEKTVEMKVAHLVAPKAD